MDTVQINLMHSLFSSFYPETVFMLFLFHKADLQEINMDK